MSNNRPYFQGIKSLNTLQKRGKKNKEALSKLKRIEAVLGEEWVKEHYSADVLVSKIENILNE